MPHLLGMMISPLRKLALDSDVCPTPVTYYVAPLNTYTFLKKTGMGDVPAAAIATSVEYMIIFSGNKSTLMRLFCRDARCEQHKMSCSHCFLCYFDGDERDAQAWYGLRSRSLRLFPSRHIIPPLCRKQTCFLQPLEVSQALHSGVSLCHRGTDTA